MTVLVVLKKEILDNWRDRQTLLYALLFGPVLLPLVIGGALVGSLSQLSIDFEEVDTLAVTGIERAPNLMQFLYANNLDATMSPPDAMEKLRRGELSVVLEVPATYAKAIRGGRPAPLTIHANTANRESARVSRRIQAVLAAYERTLDELRLQHRGIDSAAFDSLDVVQNDVSEEGASGQLFASLLPFLFIVSMVLGGFYLAIDTTAGERERHSLEPLLSLPLSREVLVIGKFGATLAFVGLSALLTAISIYLLFRFVPQGLLSGQLRFDGPAISRAFLLASPLIYFIAAMLVALSAATRSVKEAQTYLGMIMVIPMAPFFILQFIPVSFSDMSMILPMLSQYRLLEDVVLDLPLPHEHIGLSVAGTLLAGTLLLYLACRLYRRESVLS